MKPRRFAWTALVILGSVWVFTNSLWAMTDNTTTTTQPGEDIGWDNGNAGDAIAAEFILSGRDVIQRLDLLVQDNQPVYDTENLRAAVKSTEVVSEDHLMLDGHERDAVNYFPKKRLIKVNRDRWKDLRRPTETKTRLRLVLHEYLWISGVDDTNYVQSEYLIELLNIKNYSPTVWWNPVNPVNYLQMKLNYSSRDCSFNAVRFSTKSTEEIYEISTRGDCADEGRKVRIIKSTGITPASSPMRGYFHVFTITIFDEKNLSQGELVYEPEWGSCLLPEAGSCRMSGKITVGGVDFIFWLVRE